MLSAARLEMGSPGGHVRLLRGDILRFGARCGRTRIPCRSLIARWLICVAAFALANQAARANEGACCIDATNTCTINVEESQCAAQGGRFGGVGTNCAQLNPPCACVPADCNDGVACTVDSCEPITDTCLHTPDHSPCASLNNQCLVGVCDPIAGCVAQPGNEGGSCDDGLFCTVNDVCGGGVCNGEPRDCSDGLPCTDDTCDETSNQCVHVPDDTNQCADSVFCNGVETCQSGVCQPGTPPCDDGQACTIDTCNESQQQCSNVCITPVITCPGDLVYECDNVGVFPDPTDDDTCSLNPVVDCSEVSTPGELPQEETIIRTCTITNDCGNMAECSHQIEIVDTTPPDVTCPPDLVFDCSDIGDFGDPSVSDNCDPSPDVTVTVETTVNDCRQNTAAGISPPPKLTIKRTVEASDGTPTVAAGSSGNVAVCVQTIEVIDTTPPVMTSCAVTLTRCEGTSLDFMPPTCTDLCGDCVVSCVRSDGRLLTDPAPSVPITITCTSSDDCGTLSAPCQTMIEPGGCPDIPTVSEWGLVVLTLVLLIAAKTSFGFARRAA